MINNDITDSSNVLIDDKDFTNSIAVPFNPHSKHSVGSNKNLFERWFGKLEQTSLRSGTFTLATSAIGLGILSFPKAFAYFGWIGGTLIILAFGLSSLFSYYLVADVIGEWHEHKIFSEMVNYWLKRGWSRFTSVVFMIEYFISLVTYTTVMNGFFVDTYGIWIAGWLGEEVTNSYKYVIRLIFTIVLTTVLYLGTTLKKAGMIGYFGLSALIMVIFITCLCFVQLGEYRAEFEPEYLTFGPGKVFEMFLNVGIFMFGFSALSCYHEVYTTIKMPTVRRMKKVANRVSMFQMIFYLAFTLAVYFSLGRLIENKDYDVYPNKPPLQSDPNNILMKIVKAIYVFVLITNYLVSSIPLKTQFLSDFKIVASTKNNHIFSFLACFFSSFLAFIYPNVNNWISIVGSVSSTAIVIVLPALCYSKAFESNPKYRLKIIFVKIWAAIIVTVSFLCFIATILDMQGIHPDW